MSRSTLTDFELMILLSILRLGDDAYGVPIADEIESTGRRTVAIAAVYASLDRLADRGLVTSSLGDPTPERGGRAKNFFKVTGKALVWFARHIRDSMPCGGGSGVKGRRLSSQVRSLTNLTSYKDFGH
jgi:DNA-binding PadR family transcriptional regulator